eukprot:tig00021357_g20789.t1
MKQRVPDSQLNFPREDYANETFFVDLREGKLAEYVAGAGSLEEQRDAVRRFLRDRGAMAIPKRARRMRSLTRKVSIELTILQLP